ncbi:outer membrane protein [Escherichia coli]|uniref:Outer membrane protein n=1 Tax=Escherichia coli TaxID=562 RepID=A0A485JH07_ECOLX|nr:outer membrane protein [Escherichia coli]
MTDTYFAPVGSLLATTVVPSTNYTSGGASGSSVLWECDATDLPNIYFLVATNGDDRVGGFHNAGGPDGLSDVYATLVCFCRSQADHGGCDAWSLLEESAHHQLCHSGN